MDSRPTRDMHETSAQATVEATVIEASHLDSYVVFSESRTEFDTTRYSNDEARLEQASLKNVAIEDTASDDDDIDADANVKLSLRRRLIVFLGLALAVFLGSLDQTIVATAIPRIASDFNALDQVAWIGIAYMLTSTAAQPLYGRFSDIFGRKLVFLVATVIFLLGSLGCGVANSMNMLIVMRALAGLGGGGFVPMVMIIIVDIAPPRQRGQYAGIVGAVFAFSSVIGPLLGGVFTDQATWRWAFYINLPIGAVTIFIVVFLLKLPTPTGSMRDKLKRIDYLGTMLVLGFCVSLLLPINWIGEGQEPDSPVIIALFCVAAVLLAAFLFVEYRFAREPVIPLHLFKSRSVSAICLGSFLMGWVFFSPIYYLPLFFQTVRGNTATESGLVLLPFVLPVSITAIISGTVVSRVGRWSYCAFLAGGMAMATIAFGLVTLYTAEVQRALEVGSMILLGVGIGMVIQTSTLAAQASVATADAAVVTALNTFSQVIGGVIGLAVEGSVFNNQFATLLAREVPPGTISAEDRRSIDAIRRLPEAVLGLVLSLYTDAMQLQYYVMIPIAGLAAIVYLLVRPRPVDPSDAQRKQPMVMAMH